MPFPARLHHQTPGWVENGASFHVRIRAAQGRRLIDGSDDRARAVLEAVKFYHERRTWFCRLFLLMPDHVHAILAFPPHVKMSATIGAWKGFLAKKHSISWQDGYFDHRLRTRKEADECWRYIRQNPVRAELTNEEDQWPWAWWPDDLVVPE